MHCTTETFYSIITSDTRVHVMCPRVADGGDGLQNEGELRTY